MHADEVDIDAPLVWLLLAVQSPRWAGLPLVRVASAGTDNALHTNPALVASARHVISEGIADRGLALAE